MKNEINLSVPTIELAVPSINCSKAEAMRFVDNLLDLSRFANEHWLNILLSEDASIDLYQDEVLLNTNFLADLFQKHGLSQEYEVNEVVMVFGNLLSQSLKFEEIYSIKYVYFEDFETKPKLIESKNKPKISENLQQFIVIHAILNTYKIFKYRETCLFLSNAPQNQLCVEAKILDIQNSWSKNLNVPITINGSVNTYTNVCDLIENLDFSKLLKLVEYSDDLLVLIKLELFKRDKTLSFETDWTELDLPRIGPKFVESLKAKCSRTSNSLHKSILRSIVECHLGKNVNKKEHHLQIRSGNAPQRVRSSDKAKAWRRAINKSERLHIWRCPDGGVELASIAKKHDEFEIPE